MKKNSNKQAYTMMIVIILIGFMIFLTVGVLRLVLNEMKDNQALGNYSKSYIGAESAQEIALLNIKEKGYGYNEDMNEEDILGNEKTTAKIFYSNDGKVDYYSGVLDSLSYDIIPLFYIKADGSEEKIEEYELNLLFGDEQNFSWNIIGKNFGISGNGGDTTKGGEKFIDNGNIKYNSMKDVSLFLGENETNYLILFNNSNSQMEYEISSAKHFTKPKLNIISSSWMGYFKQNIKTEVDYADIVNRSKYSIYSQQYY